MTRTAIFYVSAAAALALIATGCARVEVESFRRVPEANADAVFIKSGVDFGVYSSLLADPMGIYYPEGATPPTADELSRIRSIFRNAFLGQIGDDYMIVREPGPGVLRVRASLVDLKIQTDESDISDIGGRLAPLINPGRLTLIMELIDSNSGEVLGRAADEEKIDAAGNTSDADEWQQIEVAARRWAVAFRGFLDTNLAR